MQTVIAGLIYYIYDGEMPLLELNSGGGITTTTTWGMGQVLARNTTGGRTLLLVPDAQGNVGQQVNASSGSVVAAYGYDAWGLRVAKGTDTAAKADGFAGYGGTAGYYTDSESGLTLCGHRYYDSTTGRWLTRDPLEYRGSINLYSYCNNIPIGMNDANGLDSTNGNTSGDGAFGTSMPGVDNCLGNILHYISSLENSNGGGKSAQCQLIVNCIMSLATALLGALASALDSIGPVGAAFVGCIAGASISVFQTIANWLCKKLDPCDKSKGPSACDALNNMIAGCVAGAVNAVIPPAWSYPRRWTTSLLIDAALSLFAPIICDALNLN